MTKFVLAKDDPGLFWSASLKVKRAHQHIQEIENWRRAFLKADLDAARAKSEAYRAEHPGRDFFALIRWPPHYVYEHIGPMLGDAVHNLRAALDHVAAEIVGRRGGDISRLYFPMNNTWDALVKTSEYRLIQRHAPAIARVISDDIKPYLSGGESGFHTINHLDREDKHRVVVFATGRKSMTHKIILDENDVPPASIGVALMLVDREGNQIPVTPGSAADIHNKNYGYAAADICFGETGALKDQPVVPSLQQLADLVSRTIDTLRTAELNNFGTQDITSKKKGAL